MKVTDAMFPGGSPALVEPIYSNPLLSAPFNEQLAAALRAFVLARLEVRLNDDERTQRILHFTFSEGRFAVTNTSTRVCTAKTRIIACKE